MHIYKNTVQAQWNLSAPVSYIYEKSVQILTLAQYVEDGRMNRNFHVFIHAYIHASTHANTNI